MNAKTTWVNEFAAAVTARPTPSPAAAWAAAGNFQIAAHFFGQPGEVRQASGVVRAAQEGGQRRKEVRRTLFTKVLGGQRKLGLKLYVMVDLGSRCP